FNEAAAYLPRITPRPRRAPLRPSRFNEAAAYLPRITRSPTHAWPSGAGFNEAAAYLPRITGVREWGSLFTFVLQRGRGISAADHSSATARTASAFSLQRGRGISAADHKIAHACLAKWSGLQRGRGISAADHWGARVGEPVHFRPSTRPRHICRGSP